MRRFAVTLAALVVATRIASGGSLPSRPGMYPNAAGAAALPMTASKLDVEVRGPIVSVSVAQTFRNDDNAPTEATYIFPLPPDAAVTAMAIDVGARTIHAGIERRAQAQARYEDAIAKGLDAGLLEQERPDVFTQSVAAIPPHATVTVRLRFDTMARYADGTWELVVPLVVAPRYVPGNASGKPTVGSGRSPDTDRSPDASRVTPASSPGAGGKTELVLAFESGVDRVTSPTHDLAQRGGRYVIVDAKSDRDAVVRWHAKVPAEGWVESDGFAAIVVEAPPAPAKRPTARATFVFDRAATTLGDGSLVEHGIETALIAALGGADLAATETSAFTSAAQLGAILEHTNAHHAFDLTKVLARLRPDGSPIVLVTDGLVTDDVAAIAAARALGVPVHVIGFGPAPNRSLLAAIAGATGGTLRVAVVGDDLPSLARDVLADVATPPAPFAVTWGTLAANAIVPALQPRLGAGQAVVVLARVSKPKAANARVAGTVFALASIVAPAAAPGATTPQGPLARRWARLELDELIAKGDAGAIADHALAYGLVSPQTSMVAIGEEVTVAGGVRHTRAVPVSLPAGMRWQEVKRETTVDVDGKLREETPEPTTGAAAGADKDKDDRKAPKKKTESHETITVKSAPPVIDHPAPNAGPSPVSKSERDDDGDSDENDATEVSKKHRATVATEDVSAATGTAEAMTLTGEAVMVSDRRFVRLAAALGGGLVVAHGDAVGMGALTARVDIGRATRFGIEGSLWLVDGLHAEGELGLYVSRVGIARRLELGIGPALHLGAGVGPALDLSLRYYFAPRLDFYLREGASYLYNGDAHGSQSATSAGIEASW
jgi:Ca-activated chloride channel family protein